MKTSFRTLPLNATEYSSFSLLLSQCFADEYSPSLHLFDIIDLGYRSAVTFLRRHLRHPWQRGIGVYSSCTGTNSIHAVLFVNIYACKEKTHKRDRQIFSTTVRSLGRGFVVHSNASWKIVIYSVKQNRMQNISRREQIYFPLLQRWSQRWGKINHFNFLNFKIN